MKLFCLAILPFLQSCGHGGHAGYGEGYYNSTVVLVLILEAWHVQYTNKGYLSQWLIFGSY